MFRRIGLAAAAALTLGAVSLGALTPAEARWGGNGAFMYPHGGWGHGGWGHGGWGHGGWGHGGWGHGGWGYGNYWGGGWGGGYPLFGPSFYFGPSYDYYDEPVCSVRTVRIRTYYGWRWATRRVCW
jgi:hypothetical protein